MKKKNFSKTFVMATLIAVSGMSVQAMRQEVQIQEGTFKKFLHAISCGYFRTHDKKPNVLEKLSPDVFTNKILSEHFDKQELLKLRLVNKETTRMIDGFYNGADTMISYAPGKQLRFKSLLAIARSRIFRIKFSSLSMPIATKLMELETDVECKDYIIHTLQSQIPYFLLQTFPNAHEVTALQNNMFALKRNNDTVTIWQLNNGQFQQIQDPNLTNVCYITALQKNLFALRHDEGNVTIWQFNNGQFQQIQDPNITNVWHIDRPQNNMFVLYHNNHGYHTRTIWQLNNGQFQQIQDPNLTKKVWDMRPLQDYKFKIYDKNDDTATIYVQIPTEELSPLTVVLVVLLDILRVWLDRQWWIDRGGLREQLHEDWQHIFDALPQYAKNGLLETVIEYSPAGYCPIM